MATELQVQQTTIRTAAQTDQALRSLASSQGVNLTSGMTLKATYDGNGAFIGSELVPATVMASGNPDALALVAEKVRSTMRPASREKIEQWVAELSVITAPRKSDGMTMELMLAAYSRRLAEYPADMVREVLILRTWKFFPTWAELKEALDVMLADRRAMLAACEASVPRPAPAQDPDRVVLTAEQRAALAAELGLPVIGAGAMDMAPDNSALPDNCP